MRVVSFGSASIRGHAARRTVLEPEYVLISGLQTSIDVAIANKRPRVRPTVFFQAEDGIRDGRRHVVARSGPIDHFRLAHDYRKAAIVDAGCILVDQYPKLGGVG